MIRTYDEDSMRIEALRGAQRELAIAERAGKAERYFLLWENYDALLQSAGIERNEGLYVEGKDAAEHRVRANELLNAGLPSRL